MLFMMLISYIVVSYIDTSGLSRLNEKGIKLFYILLMAVSCIIGTASGYIKHMPSPAEPIKNIVMSLVGR